MLICNKGMHTRSDQSQHMNIIEKLNRYVILIFRMGYKELYYD